VFYRNERHAGFSRPGPRILRKDAIRSFCRPRRLLAFGISAFLLAGPAAAQGTRGRPSAPAGTEKAKAGPQTELAKRLAAAQEARKVDNAYAAAQANKLVISLALRQLGQLRLIQSAYPQAAEIYRRSLDFEESPETRVDMSIAQLGANQIDDALANADQVLKSEPRNDRALTVRGRALMAKQDYAHAAEALSEALRIKPDLETYYSLGICYLATKDPKQKTNAAAAFEKMAQMAGDSGSLHVLFGRAYRDADDMPGAIREFQRAVALDTKTPHAHYFLALAKLAVNEWKPTPEIRDQFEKELQYHPKDYLANYMLGFLASSERQYDVSGRYLKIAAEVGPNWPEPWLYLGLNAYAQDDLKRAEEYLRKAVVLTGSDESRSNYQIRRAYVDLGRILNNSGRTKEGEEFLAKARELQKKTMEMTQQQISSIISEGGGTMGAVVPLKPDKDVEAAALRTGNADPFARVDASVLAGSNFTKEQLDAIEKQENQLRAVLALAFNDLATSEAVAGQYLAALGHYQEAERWDPTIRGLSKNIGLSAFRAGNYPETVRAMATALKEDPNDAPVRAILGSAYFATNDFARAAATFAPLGERAMRDSTVGYAWAASLVHTGDLKQAARVLTELDKTQLPADTLLLVGKLWSDAGDYARGVETFHRALKLNPSLPKAHYFAGIACVRWEHLDEAVAEFKAELALSPDDPDAKNGLGYVYLQQSKTQEAAKLFQSVVAAYPDNGNAQYQLGKLLLDEGKTKEAIAHLEAAARALPETDYVHYQLQAAYRKDSRIEDADRELQLYKELKARNRQASIPRPSPEAP
jgi:tetratricopeptide (TPR) repeat protein